MDWQALATAAQAGGSLINGIINHYDQQEMARLQNNLGRDQLALSRENLAFNRDVANRNFAQQQAAFQYQKELNNMQMEREDNAMQRRVEDLRKAGLSPLMVSDGAQAGNLLSGSAPQYDVSGINNAVQGVQSAHQDYQNRLFNQAQFKLQSKLQIAQLSADLMGALQQYQKNKLDYEYQKGLNEYVATHGYRNLNWQNELIQVLSKLTGGFNLSGVKDKVSDVISLGKNEFNNLVNDFSNLISKPQLQKGNSFTLSTLLGIEKDKKILNKTKSEQENKYISDLKTEHPSDSTINYIWKYTDAWRDFEHFEDFKNWILVPQNKNSVINGSKYPFLERKRAF